MASRTFTALLLAAGAWLASELLPQCVRSRTVMAWPEAGADQFASRRLTVGHARSAGSNRL